MRYGYARVSTADQSTDLQRRALRKAGVKSIVSEHASGARVRPELERLLLLLRPGDELVVYKVDRVARSLSDLLRIIRTLDAAGAAIRSLTEPIDTTTASGRLLVQLLGAFAEFERSMIVERTVAGIRAAEARGVRIGRPHTWPLAKRRRVAARLAAGEGVLTLAKELGCSESMIRGCRGL